MPGQSTLTPILEIKEWKGIDNLTTDDMSVPGGYSRVAINVDIDDEGMVHSRKGVVRSLLSGAWQDLWSDGVTCLGVKAGTITRINADWTETIILANVGFSRMNYVPIGDRIFFSNLAVVGYIQDGVAYGFPDPDREERQRMVGGEIVEYYNGRLYSVQGNNVFFSIAYSPMEMDLAKNFISLQGPITMLAAVKDGLWIGEKDRVSFHDGDNPLESMKYRLSYDEQVIPGSVVAIDGETVSRYGETGRCIIFATDTGIHMGKPGGALTTLTKGHYGVLDMESGRAVLHENNGYYQYLFMAQAPVDITGFGIALTSPSSVISWLQNSGINIDLTLPGPLASWAE